MSKDSLLLPYLTVVSRQPPTPLTQSKDLLLMSLTKENLSTPRNHQDQTSHHFNMDKKNFLAISFYLFLLK